MIDCVKWMVQQHHLKFLTSSPIVRKETVEQIVPLCTQLSNIIILILKTNSGPSFNKNLRIAPISLVGLTYQKCLDLFRISVNEN